MISGQFELKFGHLIINDYLHLEISFLISLNTPLFKNIQHVGAFWYFVICCICVFVFVPLCMRHLVISVLISLDQVLSENIWFVWSKPSYSGDKWRCYQGGTTTNNGR